MLQGMSKQQIEELSYSHVENSLPPLLNDWCIGDEILCLIQGEFPYVSTEAMKMLTPIPIERVLEGYSIYAGMVVVSPSSPRQ
jgi:hypothetical protein